MDIWGPLPRTSIYGRKYFLSVVDDFPGHTWLFFCLKQNQKFQVALYHFLILLKPNFHAKLNQYDLIMALNLTCTNFLIAKAFLISDFV